MAQKGSGRILEILAGLGRALNAVGYKGGQAETLHARILALVKFSNLRAAEIGAWIEMDAPGRTLASRIIDVLGSEVGRPRLINRARLQGAPHLRSPPSAPTLARLLSPSGAKYGLSTMLAHLRYIVVYCADELYRSDDPDRKEQVTVLARSMYRNVADIAIEQYELSSLGQDSEDEIDLRPARKIFTPPTREEWLEVSSEIARYNERIRAHGLEVRQLSAAFLLGDRPSLPVVLFASAARAATRIATSEVLQCRQPMGLWIRGAVGSGKSTLLYQLSADAVQHGWKVYFLSGLALGRLRTDLLIAQAREHLAERTIIAIDNAEFLSNEALLCLSELFSRRDTLDWPRQIALVIATQTERLSNSQILILRRFVSQYTYHQMEIQRDKAIFADRLVYQGYLSDSEPLAQLITQSGLVPRRTLSEIRAELAKRFNDRSNPLLLSSLVSVIGGKDIRHRVEDSVHALCTQNNFSMVPGFDVVPGPVALALGVIALCRYRYAGRSRKKFFCDEQLISLSLTKYFNVDDSTALRCAKNVIEILWDETFFEVQYVAISPTDPRRFRGQALERKGNAVPRDEAPAIAVGGLIDTRHPEVTEIIYRALFRHSADGIPAALDEVEIASIVGDAARQCALSSRVREYEHARTFTSLGRSFDSRVRDGYYDHFHNWASDTSLSDAKANLAARFCLEAVKAYIDSILDLRIYQSFDPNRGNWLRSRAEELIELARTHSINSRRSADLGWLRTDAAAQHIRLLQVTHQATAVLPALLSFFNDSNRIISPGSLSALCGVIRALEREGGTAPEILAAFETDCSSIRNTDRIESPFLMELGRYVRDVRTLTQDNPFVDVDIYREQNSQVLFLFREALRGDNLVDNWFVELFSICEARDLLPIGPFHHEVASDDFDSLRGTLRSGLKHFDRSVPLFSTLALLEIRQAKIHVAHNETSAAAALIGDFADPAFNSIRHLVRALVEIQAEKGPVSIASDLVPVVRQILELEFVFGRIEPIINDGVERYSIRWWIEVYLGGGREGRFSLRIPKEEDVHELVSAREVYNVAAWLWAKGVELAEGSRNDMILDRVGRDAVGLVAMALPEFRRERQFRNELRGYTLACEIARSGQSPHAGSQITWLSPKVLQQELEARVRSALARWSPLRDHDYELLIAAATALHNPELTQEISSARGIAA